MMKNTSKEILLDKGLKNTRHRELILEVFEKTQKPLTAEEIFLLLKGSSEATCLSTVYRTVEVFESKGLVIKSNSIDDGKARYEFNTMEHRHHVICIGCHKIIFIDECPFIEIEKNLKDKLEFEITGHKFEIYGNCKECQKHERVEENKI
ncbi:MAG: transcriptional repressor [Firmicutes bacterium HGW-Firmicutes-1]|nr:MAG: transcriptional repressor [Firmicutes bacterium HGW-Firmicutes-1]